MNKQSQIENLFTNQKEINEIAQAYSTLSCHYDILLKKLDEQKSQVEKLKRTKERKNYSSKETIETQSAKLGIINATYSDTLNQGMYPDDL